MSMNIDHEQSVIKEQKFGDFKLLISGIDYSSMPLITHQLPIYFSLVANISLYPLSPSHVRNTWQIYFKHLSVGRKGKLNCTTMSSLFALLKITTPKILKINYWKGGGVALSLRVWLLIYIKEPPKIFENLRWLWNPTNFLTHCKKLRLDMSFTFRKKSLFFNL